jgi:hypothetical protein
MLQHSLPPCKNGWLQKKSSGMFPKWQNRMIDLQSTSRGEGRGAAPQPRAGGWVRLTVMICPDLPAGCPDRQNADAEGGRERQQMPPGGSVGRKRAAIALGVRGATGVSEAVLTAQRRTSGKRSTLTEPPSCNTMLVHACLLRCPTPHARVLRTRSRVACGDPALDALTARQCTPRPHRAFSRRSEPCWPSPLSCAVLCKPC